VLKTLRDKDRRVVVGTELPVVLSDPPVLDLWATVCEDLDQRELGAKIYFGFLSSRFGNGECNEDDVRVFGHFVPFLWASVRAFLFEVRAGQENPPDQKKADDECHGDKTEEADHKRQKLE
jgi:hypothetical protein